MRQISINRLLCSDHVSTEDDAFQKSHQILEKPQRIESFLQKLHQEREKEILQMGSLKKE